MLLSFASAAVEQAADHTLAVAVISAAATVIVAIITVGKPIRHIRHQVQNDHETNLREDIDGLTEKLDQLLTNQTGVIEDIRQLRSDLNVERQERIALAERID